MGWIQNKIYFYEPDSSEGQFILKDEFSIWSAPDIRKKLQQLALGPRISADELVKIATSTCFDQEQEKELKAQRSRDPRREEGQA